MKKQDFIRELTAALAPIDAKSRAEIIADIEEHFAEGAAHGQTEEEICINLGQPGQIAEQVLEEYKAYKAENHNGYGTDIDDVVSSAMDAIDKSFAGVNGIDIGTSICDIKLVAAAPQSNKVRVTVQGRSRHNEFELENKNGILYVRQRAPFFRFEIFGFKSNLEMTVYVPASHNGDIKVSTSYGNISASGICNNIKLNTSAGNINIDGHRASKAYLRSSAGNVCLTGCEINDINAKSSAGNVTVECRETAALTLGSSAGNIKVNVKRLGGDANLSTSAGEVNLTAIDVQGNIVAKSSAGSVRVRLPQDANCRIDVNKPSVGTVSNYLTGNPYSPYTLRASTSVGSIVLKPLEPRDPRDPRQN